MPFQFKKMEIPEVLLIEPMAFKDNRGFLMETYKHSDFAAHGISVPLVQSNFAWSVKGVLRGLHYQKQPKAQGKLVMVIKGEIFDVAVDVRKGSPSYGKWAAAELSSENRRMLYVPPGFAHGFCVVSEEAHVVYQVSGSEYAPEAERGIAWNDPDIRVKWPTASPVLSSKDSQLLPLKKADNNFVYDRGAA